MKFKNFSLNKFLKTLFLAALLITLLSLAVVVVKELIRPRPLLGIIVITPGYPFAAWNQPVRELISKVNSPYPFKLAFLDFPQEEDINNAVKELRKERVSKIRIISLFIFSYQSHTPQLLKLLERKKLEIKTPFELTGAIDFHPLIADILLDRIKELSKNPQEEAMIYFLYGSVKTETAEHEKNIETMNKYKAYLKDKGYDFAKTIYLWACHDPDWTKLQETLEENIKQGRKVNIMPFLLGQKDSLDHTIRECMLYALMNTGVPEENIRYAGKPLCFHENLVRWIENQITTPLPFDAGFYKKKLNSNIDVRDFNSGG